MTRGATPGTSSLAPALPQVRGLCDAASVAAGELHGDPGSPHGSPVVPGARESEMYGMTHCGISIPHTKWGYRSLQRHIARTTLAATDGLPAAGINGQRIQLTDARSPLIPATVEQPGCKGRYRAHYTTRASVEEVCERPWFTTLVPRTSGVEKPSFGLTCGDCLRTMSGEARDRRMIDRDDAMVLSLWNAMCRCTGVVGQMPPSLRRGGHDGCRRSAER